MKNMWLRQNWIYGILTIALLSAILALITLNFVFKSGTAGIGIIIILILNLKKDRSSKDTWLIIGAFLFSIAGDWFLSHMNGDNAMFSKGIALFFFAHLGYLTYALLNGRMAWKFTSITLLLFLLFFFLVLYPGINDKTLMVATLIYLIISCLSFGAAVGIRGDRVVKWTYVSGIFLILFSDTIISLKEFLGYDTFNFLILPTYYLAHLSITFSLIKKLR